METLPPEIKLQIVEYLLHDPASYSINLQDSRSHQTLAALVPDETSTRLYPLKQLSLSCWSWRRFLAPLLFQHVQVTGCLLRPWRELHELVGRYGLEEEVRSVFVLCTDGEPNFLNIAVDTNSDSRFSSAGAGSHSDPRDSNVKSSFLGPPQDDLEAVLEPDVADAWVVQLWDALFGRLPRISRLLLVAPPREMAMLMQSCSDFSDIASFEIPYQAVELLTDTSAATSVSGIRRSAASPTAGLILPVPAPPTADRLVKYERAVAVTLHAARNANAHARAATEHAAPLSSATGLFVRRPWTSLRYQGGSHLNNYGTYHYFEKLPPCILTPHLALRHYPDYPGRASTSDSSTSSASGAKAGPGPDLGPPTPIPASLTVPLAQHITLFSYSAIFPHYVHLLNIFPVIAALGALQTLVVQLVPDLTSAWFEDLDIVRRGGLNLRDCWSEIERGYELLQTLLLSRRSVLAPPFLRTFVSRDCARVHDIRNEVLARFERMARQERECQEPWTEVWGSGLRAEGASQAHAHAHAGLGVWVRMPRAAKMGGSTASATVENPASTSGTIGTVDTAEASGTSGTSGTSSGKRSAAAAGNERLEMRLQHLKPLCGDFLGSDSDEGGDDEDPRERNEGNTAGGDNDGGGDRSGHGE